MALFQPAVREQLKARLAIDGPTGSGKTWTALQAARIITGPTGNIGVIDTENRSAAYYTLAPGAPEPERVNFWDPPYMFGHLPATVPYNPVSLADLIRAAAEELGPEGVLVIDSLTHYWNGEGGTLDIVENAGRKEMGGNRFAGWKEGTPAQRHLLDTIVHASCHIIVTMRSKMEYLLQEDANGKMKPTKMGMQPEQRAGVEYEFTVVADMDLAHVLTVSKSRCDPIADVVATTGRSAEVWQTFAAWLGEGASAISPEQVGDFNALFAAVTDDDARRILKYDYVREWNIERPTDLLDVHYDAALAWLTARVGTILAAAEAGSSDPATPPPPSPPTEEHPMMDELAGQLPDGNTVAYAEQGSTPGDGE